MNQGPLTQRIAQAFGTLSHQLQLAARYVIDHPRDVALLSMREQARRAGVLPATMSRLAKQLGLDGYEQIREEYAAAIRDGQIGFSGGDGPTEGGKGGDVALAVSIVKAVSAHLATIVSSETIANLIGAVDLLAKSRRIYCLSLRSMHPFSWHFHYIMSLVGEKSVLLDSIGGTGTDTFGRATRQDVLLIATVEPYTRATIEVAENAKSRGIPVVAITDSVLSPLSNIAKILIVVPTKSPGLFLTMSPAFIVSEILAVLVAGRSRQHTLEAVRQLDDHLAALKTHL